MATRIPTVSLSADDAVVMAQCSQDPSSTKPALPCHCCFE
jgi:hypothetical protein